jgi:hypothetical protein
MRWYTTVVLPMGSRNISAKRVRGKAGKIQRHMHIQRNGEKRFSEQMIVPEANDADASALELDELWSFVMKKTNQAWIWIALCRKTRQVVATVILLSFASHGYVLYVLHGVLMESPALSNHGAGNVKHFRSFDLPRSAQYQARMLLV